MITDFDPTITVIYFSCVCVCVFFLFVFFTDTALRNLF